MLRRGGGGEPEGSGVWANTQAAYSGSMVGVVCGGAVGAEAGVSEAGGVVPFLFMACGARS